MPIRNPSSPIARLRRGLINLQPSPLPGKVSGFPLERGDVLLMESSGGGGFGDPLGRDPARVAADVRDGYVTVRAAAAIYGVILRDGAPDDAATIARRAQLRRTRVRVRIAAGAGLDGVRGRAIRLSVDLAGGLGVAPGAVVELVNPHGAPLRLRFERQLGYKHAKYVLKIEVVDTLAGIGGGKGGYWEDQGYEWYDGI